MISFLILLNALIPHAAAAAPSTVAPLPPVSVLRFEDESASIYEHCERWPWHYGQRQLRSQLETALVKAGFRVQERRQLDELHSNEFELERYNGKAKVRNAQFKVAKFALAGALTEMGYCAETSGTQVAIGGLLSLAGVPGAPEIDAGARRRIAKLKLVLQLIDVATAENIKAFEAKAEAKQTDRGISVSIFGAGASHESGKSDVMEAASAEAIGKLVEDLSRHFNRK
jgi:curli biogenesis system outer membrane secretion channel CsgG